MTGREAGFLLLTSYLGDPERKVLTAPQLRTLGQRVQATEKPALDRQLQLSDLCALGYGEQMAQRIYTLLQDTQVLSYYLQKGREADCVPLTQLSFQYPRAVFEKLGLEGPGSLWCKGDLSILQEKAVSLVGSRQLREENRRFAAEAGRQAARQGYVLISGNARGADQVAQNACLEAGGKVISVVADALTDKKIQNNVLYISEDGFDLPFSAQRALSRNRVIHAMGAAVLAAQCGYQEGGTWSGSVKNLRFGWSPLYCFRDDSPAQRLLCDMGAEGIEMEQLQNISLLCKGNTLFD